MRGLALQQSSHALFNSMQSLVSITQVLDRTCRPVPDVDTCSQYLGDLADALVSEENCRADYLEQHPVVVQAYVGMRAYRAVHDAVCLTDPERETEQYCFATAATDLTTASNLYMYYLPLNASYPARAEPSCNPCTSATMAVYQAATADRESPIATTYPAAAARINQVCGDGFINASLAPATSESGVGPSAAHSSLTLLLLLLPIVTAVYQRLT